jgi:hypothetical protein
MAGLAQTQMRKPRISLVRTGWVAALGCALAGVAPAQQSSSMGTQSPRQAVLEMLASDETGFKRHLTQEMQAKIDELATNSSPTNPNVMVAISAARAAGIENMEKFESGPVLFSFNNRQQRERLEIHLDGDELRGEEDIMLLSVHFFHEGVEQELPAGLHFLLGWKLQQNVWRLNEVTISARVHVGDPRILDKSWWTPPAVGPLAASSARPAAAPTPAVADDRPRMSAARSIRLIGLAENIYARKHPDAGFTCALGDLIEIGKGLDNGETYKFMDPEFAGGVYNGYRFSLSGCFGRPAKAFRITAEPLSGTGRAYCSDATQELRASEDARATSCLASGKTVRR